jgi:SHAQKYF class myb-like DNA-binding protein
MFISARAVATPKQIRELMKVDGLTNDEVKSHLQASLPPDPNCPN